MGKLLRRKLYERAAREMHKPGIPGMVRPQAAISSVYSRVLVDDSRYTITEDA